MTTLLGFEGVVGPDGVGDVPAGYGGLTWPGYTVEGKNHVNLGSEPDGFKNVLHGKVIAFIQQAGATFTSSDATFSLKSAIIAAAWNEGERVIFHALVDGVEVAHKAFTLDQTATTVNFGHTFRHIDTVTITARNGHDANPIDNGDGSQIVIDNIRLDFDFESGDPVYPDAVFDMPHISDWPLA